MKMRIQERNNFHIRETDLMKPVVVEDVPAIVAVLESGAPKRFKMNCPMVIEQPEPATGGMIPAEFKTPPKTGNGYGFLASAPPEETAPKLDVKPQETFADVYNVGELVNKGAPDAPLTVFQKIKNAEIDVSIFHGMMGIVAAIALVTVILFLFSGNIVKKGTETQEADIDSIVAAMLEATHAALDLEAAALEAAETEMTIPEPTLVPTIIPQPTVIPVVKKDIQELQQDEFALLAIQAGLENPEIAFEKQSNYILTQISLYAEKFKTLVEETAVNPENLLEDDFWRNEANTFYEGMWGVQGMIDMLQMPSDDYMTMSQYMSVIYRENETLLDSYENYLLQSGDGYFEYAVSSMDNIFQYYEQAILMYEEADDINVE